MLSAGLPYNPRDPICGCGEIPDEEIHRRDPGGRLRRLGNRPDPARRAPLLRRGGDHRQPRRQCGALHRRSSGAAGQAPRRSQAGRRAYVDPAGQRLLGPRSARRCVRGAAGPRQGGQAHRRDLRRDAGLQDMPAFSTTRPTPATASISCKAICPPIAARSITATTSASTQMPLITAPASAPVSFAVEVLRALYPDQEELIQTVRRQFAAEFTPPAASRKSAAA